MSELKFGKRWGPGKGGIISETPTQIRYVFSSENSFVNILSIAQKYNKLIFKHFYYDCYSKIASPFYAYKEYVKGILLPLYESLDLGKGDLFIIGDGIYEKDFDLQAETMMHTPALIEELLFKYRYLQQNFPEIFQEIIDSSYDNWCNPTEEQFKQKKFYDIVERKQYLKENIDFYNSIFKKEKMLWYIELKWSKDMAHKMSINSYFHIKRINCFAQEDTETCLKKLILFSKSKIQNS